jgi:P27 family predicted phage terminase small subunit
VARKGRKPKPTAVKKAAGNPGGRRLNENEPKPAVVNLPVPTQLLERITVRGADGVEREVYKFDAARLEWLRVAPELARIGVLSKVDEKSLLGYCMNWQRWVEAQAQLAGPTSYVLMTKSGYPIPNPFLTIADKALEQMRKFAVEFGMTPSSRSGLYAAPESNKDEAKTYYEQLAAESKALTVN